MKEIEEIIGNNPTPAILATGIPFSIAQNTDYNMRLRIQGYTLYGKIYPASLPQEPAAWNVIATDASSTFIRGKLGFYTYLTQPSIKNAAVSPITYNPSDAAPPIISSVGALSIGQESAAIIWVTDEYADTRVEYGTSTAYGFQTPLDSSWALSHTATLPGLFANTTYHYRVKSKDVSGNIAMSNDAVFTTLGIVSSAPPTTTVSVPSPALPSASAQPTQPPQHFPVAPSVSPADMKKERAALRSIQARLASVEKFLTSLDQIVKRTEKTKKPADASVKPLLAHGHEVARRIRTSKTYADARDDIVELSRIVEQVNSLLPQLRDLFRPRKINIAPFPLKTMTKYILP